MALNKDVLGEALYNASMAYNDQTIDTTDAGAVETYRRNFWKVIAEQIIDHFKTQGVVVTTGNATTQTGTIS